ncbi:uncharacterized protein LOC120287206 [Eucalyptus grandis]|uniref:uncharacterized protein LOC120287206 n=1 Tax=Eucalyptus grandis TaxID=71139 RepID=UPI00192E7A19|nr:uncharacterized protein LOC120287206 [Eucalyptus grandis]
MVASILWHLWKSRNAFVFRQRSLTAEQVVQLALADVTSSSLCHQSSVTRRRTHFDSDHQWHPLASGVLKINIDGAYLTSPQQGAIACVCRDSAGRLITGFTETINASSALQSEIQALVHTLKFLLQKGLEKDHLLLESDCSVVVDAVRNPLWFPWQQRSLFAEARALLPSFPSLHIRHCRRAANFIAD